MKITRVEAYLLSFPLPEPFPLAHLGGGRAITRRDAMLVRVLTDRGITGYASAPATRRAKQEIDRVIAPFLAGRTLGDPDALRILFQQGPGADAEASRIYGAVEIALYDLAGKSKNLPVSELIGGRVRDRIRLYGSAGMCRDPQDCAAEAIRARELRLSGYKMRAGRGLELDLECVRAVREAGGNDLDLMVNAEAYWGNGFAAVEELARKLVGIRWLEDPLPPDDHEGYIRLKQLGLVPLAAGRHEPNELRYLDLIDSRAVDYVQMDLVLQGGYAAARRLLPDIARAGLRFSFHSWGTALDLIAAAHLGVCWPESVVRRLEYPMYSLRYPFPLAEEILKNPLPIERGELIAPRGPGLGVEIDENVIWRYPWLDVLPSSE